MFAFFADPTFPLFALVALSFLWLGYYWGTRSAEDRIGFELSSMGRFMIDTAVFTGRFVGYIDEEDEGGDIDGDPHTVEDILGHQHDQGTDSDRKRGLSG